MTYLKKLKSSRLVCVTSAKILHLRVLLTVPNNFYIYHFYNIINDKDEEGIII
jgi:hypothetical protein